MKRTLLFSLKLCALLIATGTAQADTMAGTWKTFNERTGVADAVVKIVARSGRLEGTVEQIFSPPAPSANPVCDACAGDKKDKPVLGMSILQATLNAADADRAEGEILDPDDGQLYRCKLRLIEGGKKLEVRGYIGIALFGRTQIWQRADAR